MTARLIIAGLGPGNLNQITIETWESLLLADEVVLRTKVHPAAEELERREIIFSACDRFYEEGEEFEQVYQNIAEAIIKKALTMPEGSVLFYGVPGHPYVAEESVQRLLVLAQKEGISYKVLPAMSFLDPVFAALGVDPTDDGFTLLDALALPEPLPAYLCCLYTQVYNQFVASDLKLALLEQFPAEHEVTILYHAGILGEERVIKTPLAELDFFKDFDHLTSVYVPKRQLETEAICQYPLDPLVKVFDRLLGENGCPWDRRQTHESLKQYLLEEAYEVLEAIDAKDMELLQEELGDVLMQIVFHGSIARKRGDFDFNDIIQGITEKLIRRHPHVFGQAKADEAKEVEVLWDQVKAKETKNKNKNGFGKIYKGLPALMMANEYIKLKKKYGLEATHPQDTKEILQKNWQEFYEGLAENNINEEKLGALLLSLVAAARENDVSCEVTLINHIHKLSADLEKKLQKAEKMQ